MTTRSTEAIQEPAFPEPERRSQLRRMDDLLEALETLNEHEVRTLPRQLADRLQELGLPDPEERPIPDLIEEVLRAQEPYMVQIQLERRESVRRPIRGTINLWLNTRR